MRSQNMECLWFHPTTQTPNLWKSLFTVILCFVLPAASSAQLADTKIAFTSDRDGNNEVYVMNADGTNPINFTNHPANDLGPFWSPDGTKIAFVSKRDGNREVYVMNADGSNPMNLTNNSASDELPSWSPMPSTTTAVSPTGKLATTWGRIKGDFVR